MESLEATLNDLVLALADRQVAELVLVRQQAIQVQFAYPNFVGTNIFDLSQLVDYKMDHTVTIDQYVFSKFNLQPGLYISNELVFQL